jgi:O-acetylserine/cysteine efflux transporter
MRPLDWAAALAVIVIWGLNFVVAKIGVAQIPPLTIVAVRFALVAALLAPFLRPLGRSWPLVVAVSVVLGGLHFGLMFSGLRGVDAGPAAIAIQLTAPFSAILAAIFYRERMGPWQMLGMGIAFAGVYVLAGAPAMTPSIPHLLLVVAAAFAWALANILIKRLRGINVFVLNAWVALLALPQLILASVLLEHGQLQALAAADWRGWGAILYMAVGASITAYGLWYYLLGKYEVNRIVPLTLLSPVLAVIFAALILDEPLNGRIVFGGLLTLAGVAMIQFLRPAARVPVVQP